MYMVQKWHLCLVDFHGREKKKKKCTLKSKCENIIRTCYSYALGAMW